MSDKENMDTKEDEKAHLKNDEGDSADVEGHRLYSKTVARSEDGEDGDTADVEAHRIHLKNVSKTEDGEDDGTPDVEAHRIVPKTNV